MVFNTGVVPVFMLQMTSISGPSVGSDPGCQWETALCYVYAVYYIVYSRAP